MGGKRVDDMMGEWMVDGRVDGREEEGGQKTARKGREGELHVG
jgi:hypothetical protein